MSGQWLHARLLVARLVLLLVLLSGLRVLFFFVFHAHFPPLPGAQGWHVALQGLRFDLATVVLWNAPFILLHLLPLAWRGTRAAQRLLFTWYMVVNGILLLLCCIDLVYFGFNNKRIGRDLLGQLGPGTRNLPSFLLDYGWVAAVFAAVMFLLWKGYRRMPKVLAMPRPRWKEGLIAFAGIGCCALLGRGGWQYQGLAPANAADYVDVVYAPLVTNSAFTFIYSLTQPELNEHRYFSDQELDRRMPLRYEIHPDPTDRQNNVVLIIVESLGREYLASLSGEHRYMPFLDSLVGRSLVFDNAFANAERSNKSICAILAGIPSFMDDAFMNTGYADNTLEGLGTRMKQNGYATSFFHGGLNGEYKFDSFSRAAGFDHFFGKDQYPDKAGFDGHWGIYDEEFLQFFASKLDGERQPFCAAVFTLSSHDPFPIPAKWKGHFPKGEQEIHESLGYADMALRRFFAKAERSAWYRNTLFVITGDHTYGYNVHPPWFTNPAGRFAVPILFFRPDGSLSGRNHDLAQHLDIMPSILDLTGFDGAINTFGRSLFKQDRMPYATQYLNGQYQLLQQDRLLFFNGEKATGLYAFRSDTLFRHDLSMAEAGLADSLRLKMQAVIQRYDQVVIHNRMAKQ